AEARRNEMCVGVPAQQHSLKENEAGVPYCGHSAQQRQQHLGNHRLDPEQERRAEEQRCRVKSRHVVRHQRNLMARERLRSWPIPSAPWPSTPRGPAPPGTDASPSPRKEIAFGCNAEIPKLL